MTKEDRTSETTALASMDWLEQEFFSGRMKRWKWTSNDRRKLEALAKLHGEWSILAEPGPPNGNAYRAFMVRFVPLYNAIHNRTKKGLCVECWGFYTFTSRKHGKFCTERCAGRAKARTKGERLKQLIERMNIHQASCLNCKRKRPCVDLKAYETKLGRWYKKTAEDEMNLRDPDANALDIAMEEQARAVVGGTIRRRK